MNLKELVTQSHLIEQKIIENNGELPEDLEILLEQNQLATKDKIDAYGFIIDRSDALREEYKNKAKFYQLVAKSFERLQDSLKFRIKQASITLGDSIEGNEYRFKIGSTKGRLIVNIDAHLLPPEFQTIEIKPNNEKIREFLDAGGVLDGCHIETDQSVRKYMKRKEI